MWKSIFGLLTVLGLSFSGGCEQPSEPPAVLDVESERVSTNSNAPKNWSIRELTSTQYGSVTAKHPCPAESDEVIYIDPLPKIREMAKTHKLVLINESHSKPLHRIFVMKVAEALAQDGFDHYGGESLSKKFKDPGFSAEVSRRGYLTEKESWYLANEPYLGHALEGIIESGYKLFAYETEIPMPPDTYSQVSHRDGNNAKHVLDYMNKFPDGRFLIHTGPHHLKETSDNSGQSWMAKYIKETSDVDPLTIAQTECFGSGYFEGGLLGYAMPVNKDGKPIKYKGFDMIVIPPKEAAYKDRPLWLKNELGRQFIPIPKALQLDDQYLKIFAYRLDRDIGAGAEDYIYREPGSDRPLALRPGHYSVKAFNQDSQIIAETKLTVE